MSLDSKLQFSPSSVEELLKNITPDIHRQLKIAVELGRWETGDKLSGEQKALCLQAIIAYDEYYLEPESRVGFVGNKKTCHVGNTDESNGDLNKSIGKKTGIIKNG
jgi:uncharacterized protein YeaC (DUF1315 family)